MSLVAYGESSGSDSEPEQEAVNSRSSKDHVRNILTVLPRPRRSNGGRGPVRIGLPKVEEGEDSDDEDTPAVKKPKQGSGGGGLKALLPEPRGVATQLGGVKKSGASSMVPYTLSKRRQEAIAAEKKKTKSRTSRAKPRDEKTEHDSDSDDDPVSFFSHLDTSQPNVGPQPSDPPPAPTDGRATVDPTRPSLDQPLVTQIQPLPLARGTCQSTGEATDYQATSYQYGGYRYTGRYGSGAQVQASPYGGSTQEHVYPSGYNDSAQEYPSGYNDSAQEYPSGYNNGAQEYPSVDAGEEGSGSSQDADEERADQPMLVPGPGLSIDEEALRRLAGGKKRRRRDESLYNVVDVSEGEVQESIKAYRKYHTEESVSKLYQPSGQAPSGMQKRKHQMTYLAYQAKANELELRKHWAQAAQTRRQSQTKYGF